MPRFLLVRCVCALFLNRAIATVVGDASSWSLDLTVWNTETIETNIQFLIFVACLIVGVLLAIGAAVQFAGRRRSPVLI